MALVIGHRRNKKLDENSYQGDLYDYAILNNERDKDENFNPCTSTCIFKNTIDDNSCYYTREFGTCVLEKYYGRKPKFNEKE